MRKLVLLLAFAVLAACEPLPQSGSRAANPDAVLLARSGVIAQDGRAELLAFGKPLAEVERRLARTLGPVVRRGTNPDCGAWPLTFSELGGLTLLGRDGELVGWRVSDPKLRTDEGIGLGSSENAVRAAYTTEFTDSAASRGFVAEGFYGRIERGVVTAMWAGTSCSFV